MRATVRTLDNQEAGDIELAEEGFGLPVRRDILARAVNWQLAKRPAGTDKTQGISEDAANPSQHAAFNATVLLASQNTLGMRK